jgi:cobalt/nickel transport system permease protein
MGHATVRGSIRSNGALAAAVLSRSWDRAQRLQEGLAGRGMESGLRVLPDERPSSRGFVVATLGGLAALVSAGVLAA